MNRSRAARYLLCLALVFGVLSSLLGGSVVLAAQEGGNDSFSPLPSQEEPPPEPELRLSCKYATLRNVSGRSFEFAVEMEYRKFKEDTEFYLNVTPPSPEWVTFITAGVPYQEQKEIQTITLGYLSALETVTVNLIPLPGYILEPGEYVVTFEASSDDITKTVDLTAVVIAKHQISLRTATGQLNTQVKAGKDNHISIWLINLGSVPIEDITFSSTKPEGWSITFNPDKIDSLEPWLSREVDVVITPAKKTIAGDYAITLRAESEQISDSLELRVTVPTLTIWGGAGIGIAVAVIASLAVLFWQSGRR